MKAEGPIQVRFAMDSSARITAVGELAWVDETGKIGGLRFTQLSDEVREQIRVWASQSQERAKEIAKLRAETTLDDVQIIETNIAKKVEPSRKSNFIRAARANQLLYNLKSPVYSAPYYQFSMFPLKQKSHGRASVYAVSSPVADRTSFAASHPIAAAGLTIVLALLVSVGIFAYVSASLAGQSVFNWGEKTIDGSVSQPAAQNQTLHSNSAPDPFELPLR